jgi:hypothetical protein
LGFTLLRPIGSLGNPRAELRPSELPGRFPTYRCVASLVTNQFTGDEGWRLAQISPSYRSGCAEKTTEPAKHDVTRAPPGVVLWDDCQRHQNLADLLQAAPGGRIQKMGPAHADSTQNKSWIILGKQNPSLRWRSAQTANA